MPTKNPRIKFLYVFFAIWFVIILHSLSTWKANVSELPYSEFLSQLRAGNIANVVIRGEQMSGEFKKPLEGQKKEFLTVKVDDPQLIEGLVKQGVKFEKLPDNSFLRDLLSWVLPTLIFFGVWIFIARKIQNRMSGGIMSLGKSRAKIYVETDTKTTFKDVAGVEEAKEELQEVVGFLKNPQEFQRLGARIPKGVLLIGPPGTGKTLLAKAIAGEAGVPFFSISGSEFVEMFVGLGAARVRDLFEQARQRAPCIIFIDELDALGKSRNSAIMGGHDEKEQTLNQLLVEMDGFDSSSGIILLAATNRPETLDPALLRAGRFDRQILVDRPDKIGRAEILRVHTRQIKIDPSVDIEQLADLTPGFTGADLANLVNEAAIIATRRRANSITLTDFTLAVERIVAGLEKKSRIMSQKEREIVAHHEMGHTLVAASLPGSDAVHKVSIIPRGIGALGYTLQRPSGDRYITTEEELRNKIKVLLGGRAAEMIIFDHLSTGAADDIQKATDLARDMVVKFGMDKSLGPLSYDANGMDLLGRGDGFPYGRAQLSQETSKRIDESVRGIVEDSLTAALNILKLNRPLLEEAARELLEKETLEESQLKGFFAKIKVPGKGRFNDISRGISPSPAV